MNKKIIFGILFGLSLLLLKPQSALAATCDSLGGTCKQGCDLSSEEPKTATGCAVGRGGAQCCVPKSLITPVACPGACKAACGVGEARFTQKNVCEASGQVCCNQIPCPGTCRSACFITEIRWSQNTMCEQSGKICCATTIFTPPGTGIETDVLCPDGTGINSAIGCIPVLGSDNGEAFYGFILGWAIGIGGGIAFLLIVYAGFMIMTSAGNPERLKAGQELLTGAISGLVLLVFSVFILNFIGINILKIPGLTN